MFWFIRTVNFILRILAKQKASSSVGFFLSLDKEETISVRISKDKSTFSGFNASSIIFPILVNPVIYGLSFFSNFIFNDLTKVSTKSTLFKYFSSNGPYIFLS